MSGQFRLHPEPGTEHDRPGKFQLGRAIYSTIQNGGLGCALLVPHFAIPIYGIYVLLHRFGYWTSEFERHLAFVVALIQGVSFGTAIALSVVRYSASGKAIKGRRIEKTATDDEETKQHRVEVTLRTAVYVFIGTLWWEYLVHSKYSPIADEHARRTSSGFLTASGSFRKFFNNESILPEAEEGRDQLAGVGLNYDLHQKADKLRGIVKNSPRIHVPGTAEPVKSVFLRTWENAYHSVFRGDKVGLFQLGPKNWAE